MSTLAKVLVAIVLGVVLAVVGVAFVQWGKSSTAASGPRCSVQGTSRPVAHNPKPRPGVGLVALTPTENSRTLTIPFGTTRTAQTRHLGFQPTEDLPKAKFIGGVIPDDLVDATTSQSIPMDNHHQRVVLHFQDSSHEVLGISVCIQPDSATHPGTYGGSLLITGQKVKPVTIPISVTLKLQDAKRVYLVAFLGALLGAILKALSDIHIHPQTQLTWNAIGKYFKYVGTWVSLITGLLAAIAVLSSQYFASETYAGEASDLVKLFLACVGAMTAGMVTVDVINPDTGNRLP